MDAQGGQGEEGDRVDALGGRGRKEGETNDENSLHEESHASNRHMTWWRNAWWVRVDNGPHMRTARGRRRIWRAARQAAEQACREEWAGEAQGREGEREGRGARKERQQQERQQQQQQRVAVEIVFLPSTASTPQARTVVTRTSSLSVSACTGHQWLLRVRCDFHEPRARNRPDDYSGQTILCSDRLVRATILRGDATLRVQSSSTLSWMW